jgi:hypothetical protein
MRIQPVVSGLDSNYTIGEMLGQQLVLGISPDLNDYKAADGFQRILNEVSWNLDLPGE